MVVKLSPEDGPGSQKSQWPSIKTPSSLSRSPLPPPPQTALCTCILQSARSRIRDTNILPARGSSSTSSHTTTTLYPTLSSNKQSSMILPLSSLWENPSISSSKMNCAIIASINSQRWSEDWDSASDFAKVHSCQNVSFALEGGKLISDNFFRTKSSYSIVTRHWAVVHDPFSGINGRFQISDKKQELIGLHNTRSIKYLVQWKKRLESRSRNNRIHLKRRKYVYHNNSSYTPENKTRSK